MLSIETISQRLADAKGKRERLISTLNRHISALEKKEREFEKTYKLKPELCSEESLRGNDKAFWDFYSIKSKNSDILSVNKRIQEAEERIQALQAELRSAKAQQALVEIRSRCYKRLLVRWKEDGFFSAIVMSSIRISFRNFEQKSLQPGKKRSGRFLHILNTQNVWTE
ncbi:MAG: hypothetical protein ACLSG5_04750 [Oscillospiraceae bacterium]